MAFNRNSRGSDRGGDRGGFRPRPSFGDRPSFGGRDRGGDRGPVEMHDAICDNCGKSCQVPFRPTSGKPVYCSSCFEHKGGADRRPEGRGFERSEDRQMFDAVCADCGNACKVPFQPTGDKPVFCSNCFGDKKNAGGNSGGNGSRVNLDELNAKLDKILSLLSPTTEAPVQEMVAEEVIVEEMNEAPVEIVEEVPSVEVVEKPAKKAKKKA